MDYAKYDEIPVTKRMLAGVDTDEHLVTRVSMITAEVSRVDTSSYSNDVCPEHGKRDDLSAHMDLQLWVKYGQRNMTDRCFGLCGISDRLNRPESDWCWDCVDRLVWGYRVSCVVTIVTKSRSLGIDVFIEEHCVYASTRGVGDGPIRAYDVIPVYVWMKENCGGHAHQWTIDRSVCGGGSDVCTVRFMALIGWTYYRLVAAGLGRTSGSGI